jgi:hypothetical protein
MTNHKVSSSSQPSMLRDAAPGVSSRTTRLLKIGYPPGPNSLIRLDHAVARAASADAPNTFPTEISTAVDETSVPLPAADSRNDPSPHEWPWLLRPAGLAPPRAVRLGNLGVAALRDAATDIATAASRERTRRSRSATAVRAADLHYAGMTPRHYQISFIASERLIEKLVYVAALVGDEDDEPSIYEVLELAVDALICDCRGG